MTAFVVEAAVQCLETVVHQDFVPAPADNPLVQNLFDLRLVLELLPDHLALVPELFAHSGIVAAHHQSPGLLLLVLPARYLAPPVLALEAAECMPLAVTE